MNLTLKIWRQKNAKEKGHFETYQVYPLKLRIWGSYPEYYYKH